MPGPSNRWRRVLAVVAALTAVLTGVLLGTGTGGAADTGRTVAVADSVAVAAPADGRQAPGCDDGSGDDGGLSPATPPRGSSAYELLPALQTSAHGASGCWAPHGAVLDLAPGRAPPPVAAPSPIDLSVLRV
ncbi:hypothetical protein [Streptomyces sp. NPDC055709]